MRDYIIDIIPTKKQLIEMYKHRRKGFTTKEDLKCMHSLYLLILTIDNMLKEKYNA